MYALGRKRLAKERTGTGTKDKEGKPRTRTIYGNPAKKTWRAPTDRFHLPTLPLRTPTYTKSRPLPINHHLPTTRGFYLHQTNKPSSTTSALLPPSLGRTWDVQSEKRKTDNLRVYLPKVSVTTTSATLLTYSARSDLLCLTGVGAESIQRLLVRYMQTVGTKN